MTSRKDRFLWRRGDMEISQCVMCSHYTGNARCIAFTDGIPSAILRNEHDHHKPYPGDNGIRFEPLEKPTP